MYGARIAHRCIADIQQCTLGERRNRRRGDRHAHRSQGLRYQHSHPDNWLDKRFLRAGISVSNTGGLMPILSMVRRISASERHLHHRELGGEAGQQIREINERYDPRLARYKAPHVTITGSSGVGPIPADRDDERAVGKACSDRDRARSRSHCDSVRQCASCRAKSSCFRSIRMGHSDSCTTDRNVRTSVSESALHVQSPCNAQPLSDTHARYGARAAGDANRRAGEIDRITVYQTLDPQPSKKLLELPLGDSSNDGSPLATVADARRDRGCRSCCV